MPSSCQENSNCYYCSYDYLFPAGNGQWTSETSNADNCPPSTVPTLLSGIYNCRKYVGPFDFSTQAETASLFIGDGAFRNTYCPYNPDYVLPVGFVGQCCNGECSPDCSIVTAEIEVVNIDALDIILAGKTVIFNNTPENIRQLINSNTLTTEQLKQLLTKKKIVFDLKNATAAQKAATEATLKVIEAIGKTKPVTTNSSILTKILDIFKSLKPGGPPVLLMIMPIIPKIPSLGEGETASTGTTGVISISSTGTTSISTIDISLA